MIEEVTAEELKGRGREYRKKGWVISIPLWLLCCKFNKNWKMEDKIKFSVIGKNGPSEVTLNSIIMT